MVNFNSHFQWGFGSSGYWDSTVTQETAFSYLGQAEG